LADLQGKYVEITRQKKRLEELYNALKSQQQQQQQQLPSPSIQQRQPAIQMESRHTPLISPLSVTSTGRSWPAPSFSQLLGGGGAKKVTPSPWTPTASVPTAATTPTSRSTISRPIAVRPGVAPIPSASQHESAFRQTFTDRFRLLSSSSNRQSSSSME
jgi:hypothetical protein